MECYSFEELRARERAALSGAGERIRTSDPLITNQMLYQLSYASAPGTGSF